MASYPEIIFLQASCSGHLLGLCWEPQPWGGGSAGKGADLQGKPRPSGMVPILPDHPNLTAKKPKVHQRHIKEHVPISGHQLWACAMLGPRGQLREVPTLETLTPAGQQEPMVTTSCARTLRRLNKGDCLSSPAVGKVFP